jgi:polyphosphate kinase 2 (PPK2 family)
VFGTAELGRKIKKKDFEQKVPTLRESLLLGRHRLKEAGLPVIVLFAGVDGARKSETVNLLNEWMDPRWIASARGSSGRSRP